MRKTKLFCIIIAVLSVFSIFASCNKQKSENGQLYPVIINDTVNFCDRKGNIKLQTSYDSYQRIYTQFGYENGAEAAQSIGVYTGGYSEDEIYYYLYRKPRKSEHKQNSADYNMAVINGFGEVVYEGEGISLTWAVIQDGFLELWDEKNGFTGLLNIETGNMDIKMEYDQLWQVFEGRIRASKTIGIDGNFKTFEYFVDTKGKILLDLDDYSWCLPYFSNGVLAVYNDDKWGYINENGGEITPFIFEEAGYFVNGIAPVRLEDGWTAIDKKGNILFSKRYERLESYICGNAIAVNGQYFGVVDEFGREIIPFNYENLYIISKIVDDKRQYFYIAYRKNESDEYFVFSSNGEILGKSQGACYLFTNNSLTKTEKTTGFIGVTDLNGGWVISPQYNDIYQDGQYIIAVLNIGSSSRKIDIYNLFGEKISGECFKLCEVYDDYMIYVETDEFYGYIGQNGEWILKMPRYNSFYFAD